MDAGPLACLVDFAGEMRNGLPGDAEIATKAAIVLDLLRYDLASQSWKGVFVSTVGRAYEQGKKGGGGDSLRRIAQWAFGSERGTPGGGGMDLNLMLSSKYRVPAALRAIALDPREVVVRASTGLDLGELRGEGLIGGKTPQMMLLWGMEAFSNPEAIETTVNYAHDHPDERPTIVASDVDGFTLDGFEAPKPEGVATLRQANVKNLTVRNCPGLPDLEPASHP